MIRRRPLWGYGFDNLELVLPGVIQPEDLVIKDLYIDRSHNLILESLLNHGFLGLLPLAYLIGLAFKNNQLAAEGQKNHWLRWGLLYYLLSHLAGNSLFQSTALAWLYLALLLGAPEKSCTDKNCHNVIPPAKRGRIQLERHISTLAYNKKVFFQRLPKLSLWLRQLAIILGLALLIYLSTNLAWRFYQADILFKQGAIHQNNHPDLALSYFQSAYRLNPFIRLYEKKGGTE